MTYPVPENVRNTVKSGGHMSDKINEKCLFELYKITGFINWLSWRNWNPGYTTPMTENSVKFESLMINIV